MARPAGRGGKSVSNNNTRAFWQPIGYNCSSFPLNVGVSAGLAELRHQRQVHPGPYMICAWSEGACIATEFLKAGSASDLADLRGGAFYGNPYRAAGQWSPSGTALGAVKDPGGAGVGGPANNWKTPASIHHYCHGPGSSYDGMPGIDQYTCCSTGEDGDIARIFYSFVFSKYRRCFFGDPHCRRGFREASGSHPVRRHRDQPSSGSGSSGASVPGHTDYTRYAGAAYLRGWQQPA